MIPTNQYIPSSLGGRKKLDMTIFINNYVTHYGRNHWERKSWDRQETHELKQKINL